MVRNKQQLRVMLSQDALKKASIIVQRTGLSMSQVVDDSIMSVKMPEKNLQKQGSVNER